jgi:hypothetical protein
MLIFTIPRRVFLFHIALCLSFRCRLSTSHDISKLPFFIGYGVRGCISPSISWILTQHVIVCGHPLTVFFIICSCAWLPLMYPRPGEAASYELLSCNTLLPSICSQLNACIQSAYVVFFCIPVNYLTSCHFQRIHTFSNHLRAHQPMLLPKKLFDTYACQRWISWCRPLDPIPFRW